MYFTIDQRPFNNPAFCKEVTETIKKYAQEHNFPYTDLIRAKRTADGSSYEWHIYPNVLLKHLAVIDYLETHLSSHYPAEMKRLKRELNTSVPDLLTDISEMVSGKSFEATLKADCKNIYASAKNQSCYTGALIDYENPQSIIGLFIYKDACQLEGCNDYSDLVDKELLIHGEISYYQPANCFQLKATSINVLGDCTRLKNEKLWETECFDILRSWDEVRTYPEPKKPSRIGLVANIHTQGYHDFMQTLEKNFGKYMPEIVLFDITMDAESITNTLSNIKYTYEDEFDYVAIVRGGGDKESLIKLCEPPVLSVIHALGNVVTGIGHTDDFLLCGRAAHYDAGTPTAAAHFLKTMDSKFYSQQRRIELAIKSEETKARTGFQSDRERADYWEQAYKRLEADYNELMNDSQSKGLWSAIKNLFC
ncbi:MAG: hypothetical protein IJU00_06965 [Selenomonas sp.]|nr:hypothetical protein [Selenomonas sp.]